MTEYEVVQGGVSERGSVRACEGLEEWAGGSEWEVRRVRWFEELLMV